MGRGGDNVEDMSFEVGVIFLLFIIRIWMYSLFRICIRIKRERGFRFGLGII